MNLSDSSSIQERWKDHSFSIGFTNSDSSTGSVGVVVVSDGMILTGTRNRDTGMGLIGGPGGHIKPGETPEQAAIRETEEEFGIAPNDLILIGQGPAEGDTGLRPYVFLCTDYNGTPTCVDGEMADPQFLTLEEIQALSYSLFKPFADGVELMKREVLEKRHDGGPGSGNHGHEGVKGQLGGSAPKGSNVGGEPHKPISQRSSPALKSPKNFDDYVKENGLIPLYRGFSAPDEDASKERAKQLYNGKSPLSGDKSSAIGVGVYFSEDRSEAEGYMNRRKWELGDKNGMVVTAALDVGAKVADQETINSSIQQKFDESRSFVKEAFSGNYSYEEMMELGKKSDELNKMDIGTYAKGKGYDAMRQYDGTYVVMNQNALVIKDELGNDTD